MPRGVYKRAEKPVNDFVIGLSSDDMLLLLLDGLSRASATMRENGEDERARVRYHNIRAMRIRDLMDRIIDTHF